MSTYVGIGGAISGSGSQYVTNIRSWSVTIQQENVKTLEYGDANSWELAFQGVRRWFGTYECYLDTAVVPLVNQIFTNTAQAVIFTSTTNRTIFGNILISGMSEVVIVDGDATVVFSFDGTGQPTIT